MWLHPTAREWPTGSLNLMHCSSPSRRTSGKGCILSSDDRSKTRRAGWGEREGSQVLGAVALLLALFTQVRGRVVLGSPYPETCIASVLSPQKRPIAPVLSILVTTRCSGGV